jgi:hypothetical protein
MDAITAFLDMLSHCPQLVILAVNCVSPRDEIDVGVHRPRALRLPHLRRFRTESNSFHIAWSIIHHLPDPELKVNLEIYSYKAGAAGARQQPAMRLASAWGNRSNAPWTPSETLDLTSKA